MGSKSEIRIYYGVKLVFYNTISGIYCNERRIWNYKGSEKRVKIAENIKLASCSKSATGFNKALYSVVRLVLWSWYIMIFSFFPYTKYRFIASNLLPSHLDTIVAFCNTLQQVIQLWIPIPFAYAPMKCTFFSFNAFLFIFKDFLFLNLKCCSPSNC